MDPTSNTNRFHNQPDSFQHSIAEGQSAKVEFDNPRLWKRKFRNQVRQCQFNNKLIMIDKL